MAITPAPGYMVDPNNPNAVIKAPTTATPGSYAAIQQQASQPSIAFGAVNTGPIPVSTLTSTAQPFVPPPQPPMPQVAPTVNGAIAGATTPPPVTTPTPAPTESMSFSERLKTMLGSDVNTFLTKPTSLAEQRTSLRSEYDIAGKEKAVNDLSAQLASITAKYQTAPLILEQQAEGRGITTDVLNRQQAQAQRNYAIEALPVTAALNAAQGRLDSANKNITELLGVIKEDQDATYTYQKDVLARAIDIASEDQKRELEARSAQLDAQKARRTQLNSIKNSYIDAAIKAGDYATAGSMANVTDESQLVSLASQIRNTNPDLQFVSGTDNQAAGYFNKTTGVFTPLRTGGGGTGGGTTSGSTTTSKYINDLDAIVGTVLSTIPSKFGQETFNKQIASARNDADKINLVAAQVLKGQPAEFKNDFRNQSVGISMIDKAIAEIDNGIKTGAVNASKQYLYNLAGKDFDPGLARINGYITSAIQPYRNSVTGAAWGDQEESEYQSLFGSTKYSPTELKNRLLQTKELLKSKSAEGLNSFVNPLGTYENQFTTGTLTPSTPSTNPEDVWNSVVDTTPESSSWITNFWNNLFD